MPYLDVTQPEPNRFVSGEQDWNNQRSGPNVLSGFQLGKLDAEWFWVFGYGTLSVLVFIFNTLILFSIGKNRFLHTNTHRYESDKRRIVGGILALHEFGDMILFSDSIGGGESCTDPGYI